MPPVLTSPVDRGVLRRITRLNVSIRHVHLSQRRNPLSRGGVRCDVYTDIPSRHLQLFRDNSTSGLTDTSFMLRVTAVPEPGGCLLLLLGLTGLLARAALGRRRFSTGLQGTS